MQNHTLRPFQQAALDALIHHDHVILTAPTGSGKSLIFQEYLKQNPMTRALLISPLNALSRQHQKNLAPLLSLDAEVSTSNRPPSGSGVWIVNPEQLKINPKIKAWKPDLLIVDEAHCIWEWGESFRPTFKNVLKLVNEWKIKKSFWCTATLHYDARQELLSSFEDEDYIELGKFEVPQNLLLNSYRIFLADRTAALHDFCTERKSKLGIIFFSTRKLAERYAVYFKLWNIPAYVYHAGLSSEERLNLEYHLKNVDHGVILATSAFGMGIDLSRIRYSVLFQPPFTLLALMQSLGRATRSTDVAEGAVFWHEDDFTRCEWMIQENAKHRTELMKVKAWCESRENKRDFLESYFNSTSKGCLPQQFTM